MHLTFADIILVENMAGLTETDGLTATMFVVLDDTELIKHIVLVGRAEAVTGVVHCGDRGGGQCVVGGVCNTRCVILGV